MLWEVPGQSGAERPQPPSPASRLSRTNPPGQQRWLDEGPVPVAGLRAPGARTRRRPASGDEGVLPREVTAELTAAAGSHRGSQLAQRLEAAMRAYARDRYAEAVRITKALADEVPDSASARELHGLVCYRLGRYREALRHLEAARRLSGGDPSQLPVLMDCERALGRRRKVRELWEELRAASPSADVLAEGRLVFAAQLADAGDLQAATDLLLSAGAARNLRRPADRHVRQWYLLADLAERAGDLPRARELFARVVEADPEVADAAVRLAALGRRGASPRPKRRAAGRAATPPERRNDGPVASRV
ncbi:MAG TPA: tetratricopeptide repeat protein [Acidimicrobiales bacterium]|nr:tetratricopeptide repeat protein [Acidimicrobiales bacterium]